MKVNKNINKLTTTHSEMARALKISRQRIGQLVQEGVLPVDKTNSILLVDGIKSYCRMKLDGDEEGQVDFDKERARHEKAKREIAELKLAQMQHKAYSAKTVEYVLTEMLSNLRTQLLGLPSKMAPIMEGKSKDEIYKLLTHEIEDKLMELSDYSPDLFDEDVEEEEEDEDS